MSATDQIDESDREAALAGLTPEERAAVEAEDDLSPEEIAKQQAAEDKAAGITHADDDDEGGSLAAAPIEGKDAPNTAVTLEDDEGDEGAALEANVKPVAAEPREFSVSLRGNLPENFAERQADLDSQQSDLMNRFKGGDVDADEFVAETNRINAERAEWNAQRVKAEVMNEITEQTAQQKWQWHVDRYIARASKDDGVDYRAGSISEDFDQFVRALASKPENQDKDYDWFLSEAHKRVKVLHGIKGKTDDALANNGKPAGSEKTSRKPPVASIPSTLANVPGGDGPGDVADEFSHIDKLTGLDYERALMKMSPEQRDRYMAAA